MTCEKMRGCGQRKVGGLYAVGNGATVGGNVTNDCRFVRFPEPIPFPKEAPNPGRAFLYVDGQAILEGQPPDTWKLTPGWGEALKLMWELWGMARQRFNCGVCEGLRGSHATHDRLQGLEWAEGSMKSWPNWMETLIRAVEDLREEHGDCPLVPAIMEVRRMMWQGPLRQDPAGTLAYCHRLVTELSWVGPIPRTVVDTMASIMQALGAEADVPLLEKFCVEYEEESHGETNL